MICLPMAVRLSACVLVPATIAGLLVLLAAGCSGRGVPATGRATLDLLPVAVPGRLDPFPPYRDPVLSAAVPWPRLLGRGLVRIDARGRLRADLARRVTTPDGGLTWDFELHSDLRLADGHSLSAAAFCALWVEQNRQQAGAAWMFRETVEGPIPVGSQVVRFRLDVVRPLFAWRLSHPWTFLFARTLAGGPGGSFGPYLLDEPGWPAGITGAGRRGENWTREVHLAPNPLPPLSVGNEPLLLMQSPPAGGTLLLRLGDARAARLTEQELAAAGKLDAEVSCARPATWYALLLQSAGVRDPGPALRRQLALTLDRARLARRAAPSTGRAWHGAKRPPAHGVPEEETGALVDLVGVRISILIDADDPVGRALADQIQADLLDRGVDVRIEAASGHAFDRLLREGQYGLALAGFRTVFGEAALDLVARVRAAGFRTRELEEGLQAMLALRAGGRRRQAAARLTALVEERRMWIPLVAVDECWAHARDLSVAADLAALTSVKARRFETRRPEPAP